MVEESSEAIEAASDHTEAEEGDDMEAVGLACAR